MWLSSDVASSVVRAPSREMSNLHVRTPTIKLQQYDMIIYEKMYTIIVRLVMNKYQNRKTNKCTCNPALRV